MSLFLLLESSTEVCSVALSSDEKLIDNIENLNGLNHSELLTVYIEELLKRNKIQISDIDAFVVSKGPGSYTGLRIGISAVKGLSYAAGKPIVGISTLDAMADYLSKYPEEFQLKTDDKTLICPMIDARRMEVYTALYNKSGEQIESISAKIIENSSFEKQLKENKIIYIGNGAQKCKDQITSKNALFNEPFKASARFMIPLAYKKFKNNDFEDVAYFEPYYLKDFVATIPKNKII